MSNFTQINSAATGKTCAFTGAITVHHALVSFAWIAQSVASCGAVSVSDGTNGAWTVVPGFPVDDQNIAYSLHAWYLPNSAAATPTVTWSYTGTPVQQTFVGEVPTVLTSNVLDNGGARYTQLTVTFLVSSLVTQSNHNDLLIAFYGLDGTSGSNAPGENNSPATPSSGWISESSIGAGGGSSTPFLHVSSVVTTLSNGAMAGGWTNGTGCTGVAGIIGIKITNTPVTTGVRQWVTQAIAGNVQNEYLPPVLANNALIAIARIGQSVASCGTVTVSDAVNGAWTSIPGFPLNDDSGGNSVHAWYFQNTAAFAAGTSYPYVASSIVTWAFTNSGTASFRMWMAEISTAITSGIIDNSTAQTVAAASTIFSTPTLSTTNANDLLLAFFEENNGNALGVENASPSTPSSGWQEIADVGPFKLHVSAQSVAATSGAYQSSWTLSPSTDDGSAGIVAIKLSAAAIAAAHNRMLLGIGN